jgi:hypothetical protein
MRVPNRMDHSSMHSPATQSLFDDLRAKADRLGSPATSPAAMPVQKIAFWSVSDVLRLAFRALGASTSYQIDG